MAALLQRQQIQIEKTSTSTTIPNNPVAKLMYYFNCVCSCIDDDDDSSFSRLRQYKTNYNSLSDEEEAMLLVLCLALSPDKLIDSVFFHNEQIDCNNEFFKVSAVSTQMLVSESLLIGGQRRRVQSIMMFKKVWIEKFFIEPLKAYMERPNRGRAALPAPQPARRQPVYSPPTRQTYTPQYYSPPARQEKKCVIL